MLTAGRHTRWAAGAVVAFVAACGTGGSSTSGGLPSTTVTTAPPTTAPTTTAPKVRSASLGETFFVAAGESVSVAGAGLSVTFASVVSDSRCPPGVQCIQAGNAVISVTVTRPGAAPATLALDTDGPRSARSGNRSVELVGLSFGRPAVARLKVS